MAYNEEDEIHKARGSAFVFVGIGGGLVAIVLISFWLSSFGKTSLSGAEPKSEAAAVVSKPAIAPDELVHVAKTDETSLPYYTINGNKLLYAETIKPEEVVRLAGALQKIKLLDKGSNTTLLIGKKDFRYFLTVFVASDFESNPITVALYKDFGKALSLNMQAPVVWIFTDLKKVMIMVEPSI